jgi:diguanylate cyclase (GGDEF)-like protein
VKEVKRWVGSELFHGAVYGLGMSLAIWIPLNTGTLADGRLGILCLACALTGLSRNWAGWPAPAALPWVAAAWILGGAGSAMLVAVLATAGSGLICGVRRTPGLLAYDVGAVALAVAAADGIATRVFDQVARGIVFAAIFTVVLVSFHVIRRLLSGANGHRIVRNLLLTIPILACGIALTWLVVALWAQPALRVWLVIAPAIRVGALIGSATASLRERRRRRRNPTAPNRLRDRTAGALARTLPEGAPGGHLWRVEALSRALAERLGSEPVEVRRLRQAALLHHVGRLAYDDAAIEVHPKVVETTIGQLGFSDEVRTILTESQEHWNGEGARGLRGERIARGARILAVADRYDELTHPPSGKRPHTEALALLRREPGERFDPLMFEILDELSEQLEATDSDLTRAPTSTRTSGRSRLVDAENDLQTLYSIERAAELPIGLRERLTLIAGLLRTVVPFERLRIELEDHDEFRYGDRDSGADERVLALRHGSETVGRLTLSIDGREPLDRARTERLERVAMLLAGMIAAADESETNGVTDQVTGLPNARYLRRILALRIPESGHAGPGFGLIALHVGRLADLTQRYGKESSDRFLQVVAQRLATACDPRETLVRLGPDQFIVLTGESRGGELVRRWHALVDETNATPIPLDGRDEPVRLDAAHAAHPLDGERFDDLLRTLETRLTGSTTSSVLPFRDRRAG